MKVCLYMWPEHHVTPFIKLVIFCAIAWCWSHRLLILFSICQTPLILNYSACLCVLAYSFFHDVMTWSMDYQQTIFPTTQPMTYTQLPSSKPATSPLTPPTTPKMQGRWPGSELTPNNPAPIPCLWATAHRVDCRCSLSMMTGEGGEEMTTPTLMAPAPATTPAQTWDRMTTRTIEGEMTMPTAPDPSTTNSCS